MTEDKSEDMVRTEEEAAAAAEPVTHVPACDVIEQPNGVKVLLDMPGVEAGQLEIQVNDRILKVGAVSPFARHGRPIHYERSFQLSDDIDCAGITARVRNGVLELSLPKLENAKVHKIKVVTD